MSKPLQAILEANIFKLQHEKKELIDEFLEDLKRNIWCGSLIEKWEAKKNEI